ncbi:hypothetical protein DM860_008004 [Cuscuta australis]|uniref:Uncharacterized protein n=1 Tax=Cuscuta australis TaxID=267555 RepID=A0A328DYM8_9ASTE|nr:hypothetical protein DM860_008004 [Cuscuta australis]
MGFSFSSTKRFLLSVAVLVLFISSSLISSTQSRRMLPLPEPDRRKTGNGVVFGKAEVGNAAAAAGGGGAVFDEKLVVRHLAALDRILRSVPSPSTGN